jgi:hypothetical protein
MRIIINFVRSGPRRQFARQPAGALYPVRRHASGPDANVLPARVNQFSTKSPISRLPVVIGARYTLCCGATGFVKLPV